MTSLSKHDILRRHLLAYMCDMYASESVKCSPAGQTRSFPCMKAGSKLIVLAVFQSPWHYVCPSVSPRISFFLFFSLPLFFFSRTFYPFCALFICMVCDAGVRSTEPNYPVFIWGMVMYPISPSFWHEC